MSNDMTLATVKHGGCVQLATVPYDRARELIGDAYNAGTHGIGYSQQIMELHDAVFAARPSPAGQVHSWAIKLARESAFAHSNEHAYLPQTREETNRWQPHEWVVAAIQAAALGAPQPVGEPVDDDAASEAFGEFTDDYLTDSNGYAPASTYEACSKAFTAAWPDRVAATAAARAELKRLHGDDRTVGARRAEALNRADARDDAEDDAPPAQAVDLGQLPHGIRLIEIPGRNNLDPINVFVKDYELGRGRIVVTCYGQAWCGFWGAMGDRTVMQFVAACDADYVAGNMLSGRHEHVKKHERAYVERIATEVIAEFRALIGSQAVQS